MNETEILERYDQSDQIMRTNIPEKLLKIVEEIDERGDANLTRLAVLKKWFERPERLSAFAIWVAATLNGFRLWCRTNSTVALTAWRL